MAPLADAASIQVGGNGGAVDVPAAGELDHRRTRLVFSDHLIDFCRVQAPLPLWTRTATISGTGDALGATLGGGNAVTRPFRV